MQSLLEVQETSFTALLATLEPVGDTVGAGTFWIDHLAPVQRSAIGNPPDFPLYPPTAMHTLPEVQATALRELPSEPLGVGAAWMDQPAAAALGAANAPTSSGSAS